MAAAMTEDATVIDLTGEHGAVQHRSDQRFAAKVIRANAGIASEIRTTAVAEIGAAARRLRASTKWNDSAPLRTHRPIEAVAPVPVSRAPRLFSNPTDAPAALTEAEIRTAKRVHPAGAGLPRRLHLA